MGAVVKVGNNHRLLVKGAAEIMLSKASQTISAVYDDDFEVGAMSSTDKEGVSEIIDSYARHSLRTIGMLYKTYEQWPPVEARRLEEDRNMANFDDLFYDLTWVGVVGNHDPLREGVIEAVAQCQQSGVIRVWSLGTISSLHALSQPSVVSSTRRTPLLWKDRSSGSFPTLKWTIFFQGYGFLARSSPEDKRILVARLKHLGETVAVTGDGTNDGPALKTAGRGILHGDCWD